MKIQGKELNKEFHYLDRVTYVPDHVKGNAGHEDCERGVIISWDDNFVKVLYCNSRVVQSTIPENLVWG